MQNHKKVISFPTSPLWSFFDVVEGGVNRIESWYQNDLSHEGRDSFDALLKNTKKIENHLEWGGFKILKGDSKKHRIWQLDFIADKRQYRLLGRFRPQRQAVLLMGCYHKGKLYMPRDAIETACKRAKALEEGRATVVERPVSDDI